MKPIRLGIVLRGGAPCGILDYAECLASLWTREMDIRRLDSGSCSTPEDWRRLARQAEAVDLVHVHYEYNLFGRVSPLRNHYAALLRALPVPAVTTLHDAFPRLWRGWADLSRSGPAGWIRQAAYLPFLPSWENAQYRRAAHSIAHTSSIARRAARAAGSRRVWQTPHPVPRCAHSWAPSDRPPARTCLVSPGFIKEHKGYEEALPVFLKHPGWTWVLAGGPQDQRDRNFLERLRGRIAEGRLSDRIRITGYLPVGELERVTAAGDAAFFPFRHATGSGSAALALGLGMPILATGIPSMRELVDAGACLALLDPANPGCWPDTMGRLLEDSRARQQGAAQNHLFAGEYGYDRLAQRMRSLFESLLENGPEQSP